MARVLLVHGAMADGSSWTNVIRHLHDAGISVTAVQQPLTSIEDDVKVVKTAIETLQDASAEPIVVVGHSFGGVVITNAVSGMGGIKALVYVMAFAPDEGETVAELSKSFPELESNKLFVANAAGYISLTEPDYLKYFAPDVSEVEGKILAATGGPCDTARFGFVSGRPAWKEVDKLFYIVGDADQIITPELETFFAQRMKAKTTHLRGASHAGLISQASAVAQVIVEAAKA